MEQVLGYSPSELGHLDAWKERIHPEDSEEALRLLADAEQNLTSYDATYRFRHRDGHYVHLHDRGFFVQGASGKAEGMVGC